MKKINELESDNNRLNNELKKDKYPDGGLIYVMDYSVPDKEIYRIGMTGNMNKRKKIYDTHTLEKHKVVHIKECECPIKLETCVKAMLFDDRVKDRKDFFACSIIKIKKAITSCIKNINCVQQQNGGTIKQIIANMEKKKTHTEEMINKYAKMLR